MSDPVRYKASWRDWYYEAVELPGLRVGDSLPVREDRVTDADLKAAGEAIHGYACGCEKPWPPNANYEEMALAVCAALLAGGSRS